MEENSATFIKIIKEQSFGTEIPFLGILFYRDTRVKKTPFKRRFIAASFIIHSLNVQQQS